MRAAIYCRLSEEDRDKRHEGDDSADILVGKRIPGSRDVPVEIHWNF